MADGGRADRRDDTGTKGVPQGPWRDAPTDALGRPASPPGPQGVESRAGHRVGVPTLRPHGTDGIASGSEPLSPVTRRHDGRGAAARHPPNSKWLRATKSGLARSNDHGREAGGLLRGVAPGGVEPPRTDSKSVALSAELRGLETSVTRAAEAGFARLPPVSRSRPRAKSSRGGRGRACRPGGSPPTGTRGALRCSDSSTRARARLRRPDSRRA